MRPWTVTMAIALLLVGTLPVPSQAACPCSVSDSFSVSGDTWVFKLDPQSGLGTEVLEGSTVEIDATYPSPQGDITASVAVWDPVFRFMATFYATTADEDERFVQVSPGGATSLGFQDGGPVPVLQGTTMTWDLSGSQLGTGAMYLVVSMPGATSLDVTVDLTFDRDVDYTRGPANDQGQAEAPADQTGGAGARAAQTAVAAGQGLTGEAPDGMRGFSMIFFAPDSTATGSYTIDGPDQADNRTLVVDEEPPTATVMGGPEGTYRLQQELTVVEGGQVAGPIMVFYAADLSF